MTKHLHFSDDRIDAAMAMQKSGDLLKAEKAFQKIITADPYVYKAYDRLMVIYRRQKAYRKELTTVNKAIKAFVTGLVEKQKQWVRENKSAARLSRKLATSLGIIDKKGMPLTDDPLLVKWKKRKAVILKRLGK